MLVNLNAVLKDAQKNRYAVGLFNTTDMEMLQGVIEAAEETKSPVIIGTAEVLLPYGELKLLSPSVIEAAKTAEGVEKLDYTINSITLDGAEILGDVNLDARADGNWWYEGTGPYTKDQAIRLAGGYNANIFRLMRDFEDADVIPIGKRACERYGKQVVLAEHFSYHDAYALAKQLCEEFALGKFGKLGIVYTKLFICILLCCINIYTVYFNTFAYWN